MSDAEFRSSAAPFPDSDAKAVKMRVCVLDGWDVLVVEKVREFSTEFA
jgi:hypothetical protein